MRGARRDGMKGWLGLEIFFVGGGKEEVGFCVIGDFFLIVLGMAWRRCILPGARVGDLDVGSFDKEIFWS